MREWPSNNEKERRTMAARPAGFKAVTFVFVISMIAVLYWLTFGQQADPCAAPQSDISGAVLADDEDAQDALVNRAIVVRANCANRKD
ncbi:hypothetical protein GCM10007053_10360 [Halioglobus pacificus]|uniref:Uncharacterized protein n=2 Tax=Parahalioglobus pacificus TaxID=930806 RepID=A0A919CJY5_9GAMM|nr:hypothetical protein GCM10007053_10360 [Halioglobus pacificus]